MAKREWTDDQPPPPPGRLVRLDFDGIVALVGGIVAQARKDARQGGPIGDDARRWLAELDPEAKYGSKMRGVSMSDLLDRMTAIAEQLEGEATRLADGAEVAIGLQELAALNNEEQRLREQGEAQGVRGLLDATQQERALARLLPQVERDLAQLAPTAWRQFVHAARRDRDADYLYALSEALKTHSTELSRLAGSSPELAELRQTGLRVRHAYSRVRTLMVQPAWQRRHLAELRNQPREQPAEITPEQQAQRDRVRREMNRSDLGGL